MGRVVACDDARDLQFEYKVSVWLWLAQLAEQSPLTPEIRSLNPVKIFYIHQLVTVPIKKDKNKETDAIG